MARKDVKLGLSKGQFVDNINSNFIELYNSSSGGLTEISTQYIRIWDLDEGIYQLTYAGTKYIYYNGATATSTASIGNSTGKCLLLVTSYSTTYKNWECHYGTSSYTTAYIVFGATSSTSGNYVSRQLYYIPTSTITVKNPVYSSSQYSIGYYYSTTALSSINTTTYLVPGEYGLRVNASATGLPYTPEAARGIVLKTEAAYYTRNATYAPTIKQDLFIDEDNRTFTRFVTYVSASSVTYGEWIETTAGELPIASADTLGAIKVGSGLSINASGTLSASSKASTLYPGKVITSGTTDSSTFVSYSEYYWMILPKMDPTVTITFTYGSGSTLQKTASVGKPLMIHAYYGATGGVFQLAQFGDETPSYIYGISTLNATPNSDIAVYYISAAV